MIQFDEQLVVGWVGEKPPATVGFMKILLILDPPQAGYKSKGVGG